MRIYLDNCCYNRPYDDQLQMRIVNAEHFIAAIKRESSDYTAWQREYYDQMKPGQVRAEALEYAKDHPHRGKGKRL